VNEPVNQGHGALVREDVEDGEHEGRGGMGKRQRRAELEEELGRQRERRCVERARAVPPAGVRRCVERARCSKFGEAQ
jgi:hypothetical protein